MSSSKMLLLENVCLAIQRAKHSLNHPSKEQASVALAGLMKRNCETVTQKYKTTVSMFTLTPQYNRIKQNDMYNIHVIADDSRVA